MDSLIRVFFDAWPYIVAILVLALLVFVHELGHFLSARAVGLRVDEFAIGMGPKLISIKGRVTRYSLRAIPLGGFCRYHGEDEDIEDADAFNRQPVWKRFISIICGPLMNLLAAVVILLVLLSAVGLPRSIPEVGGVVESSAAMDAGMVKGDRIVSVNGLPIDNVDQLVEIIRSNPGTSLSMELLNGSDTRVISVAPRTLEDGSILIGINFATENIRMPFNEAIGASFTTIVDLVKEMLGFLRDLVFTRQGAGDISGPVGIVVTIGDVAREGSLNLLYLMAFISVNLGVMNMLPIPALDGSRLIFLIIEGIRRKPFNRNREALVHLIGLGALLVLIVVVTYKDILRLFQ